MELEKLAKNWDKLGDVDPLWAVLYNPDKKGNRWDPEEFFATGRRDIAESLDCVRGRGIELGRDRALDFGCGVGRLAQALAEHFDHVDGVDIAASMIDAARQFNRYGDRVEYHLNIAGDLSTFPDDTFDFVNSRLVLQHIEPRFVVSYLREFVRVTRPGGCLLFDMPSSAKGFAGLLVSVAPAVVLNTFRRVRYRNGAVMELHTLKTSDVIELLTSLGAQVVADQRISAAHGAPINQHLYCARKE